MKKHINPFKILIIGALFLSPALLQASEGENIEKKRNIEKTYTVSGDDKLSIENSFGDVTVSTWDKNEISVMITIGVNASSEEKATHMMDEISVSDSKTNNEILFRTEIGNMGKGSKKSGGDQRKFYIDYKIIMPSGNPLRIENSFGKIIMGSFIGPVNLTSKFGELTTGKLSNAKTLHVEFGNAEIGPVNNADITFKFNGKSYIKNIGGSTKVHIEFCNNVEFTVDNSLKDLNIFESYSNVRLNVPDNFSASFDIHTNFGSFKNSSGFNIPQEKEDDNMGPKFDNDYSGVSGNGNAKIKIKSSFGKIRLANANDKSVDKEDARDDDKDEDKDNDKKVNL